MEKFLYCSFPHRNFKVDDSAGVINFTLEELNAYTDGFHGSKFIGRGAFGPVYGGIIKGRLERNVNGQQVAVKFSRNKDERARIQWQAEVEYLPKVMHQNIIKLIGYCETPQRFYIVYPFMQNGTVSSKLQGLDWIKTLKIIKGVACAIEKLHGLMPPLIHRDIKLDNILLDKNFIPKLADFGQVTPEADNLPSGNKADDIYDFGTIILQLIMKENNSYCIGANSVKWHISDWASRIHSSNEICVKAKLTSTGCYKQVANSITKLGLDCCYPIPSHRPTIAQVLQKLSDL